MRSAHRLENEARTGFVEVRGNLDQTAGGQQQMVNTLTDLIAGQATSNRAAGLSAMCP